MPTDQIRSVTQSCPTLCDPMNRSTPGLPVHSTLQFMHVDLSSFSPQHGSFPEIGTAFYFFFPAKLDLHGGMKAWLFPTWA